MEDPTFIGIDVVETPLVWGGVVVLDVRVSNELEEAEVINSLAALTAALNPLVPMVCFKKQFPLK